MSDKNKQSESDADELVHQQAFGHKFKVAREAAGLSFNDISEALKLAEEIIRALESSKVDVLPASAFTQGYIRNYARLLKIPEDDILEIYNQHIPDNEAPLTARSSLNSQVNGYKVKLVTYTVSFVLLFGVLIWLLQPPTDINKAETDIQNISVINPENNMQNKKSVRLTRTDNVKTEQEKIEIEIEKIDNKTLIPIEKTINKKQSIKDKVPEKKIDNSAEKISSNELPSGTENDITEVKNTNDITEFKAESGDDVLIVGTISKSWVEVSDAGKQRLVFELIKQGGVYRIQGQAPFKVFLGNAPSVSLQLNGKAVNVLGFLKPTNIAHVYIYKNGEVIAVSRKEKPEIETSKNETPENVTADEKSTETVEQ